MSMPVAKILQKKQDYEDAKFHVEHVHVEGVEFPYFVLPQNMGSKLDLKLFAVRMTPPIAELQSGTNRVADITLFGVSDSIPEQYRPFVAAHEIIEYCSLPLEDPGSRTIEETDTIPDGCLHASQREWEMVLEVFNPKTAPKYAAMRMEFFTGLVLSAQQHPKAFPAHALEHFRKSVDFWYARSA